MRGTTSIWAVVRRSSTPLSPDQTFGIFRRLLCAPIWQARLGAAQAELAGQITARRAELEAPKKTGHDMRGRPKHSVSAYSPSEP